ncbi:MAG: cysteine--tRNA ligase, partial [Patescibacteria group bacterium]|nr:cysteine--tRNA ligase [Patescibacteria group bacterium]
ITDVGHLTSDGDTGEDKLEKGAKRENKSVWDIAEFYTQAFFKDLERLNIKKENFIFPKATDYIQEQINLILELEKKGFTYKIEDGIYFDTSLFNEYFDFAKIKKENLDAGKRVDIKDKKNISDFALWKFSPKNEKRQMEWQSPWGVGFPGWHIECSAMSRALLGEHFD